MDNNLSSAVLKGLLQPEVVKIWLFVLFAGIGLTVLRGLMDRGFKSLSQKYGDKKLKTPTLFIILIVCIVILVCLYSFL